MPDAPPPAGSVRPGPGVPGWVKGLGLALLVLVVVLLVVLVAGIGGDHGPGQHG